jgi:hypothetical protein
LTDLHRTAILMQMRTTLILDESLLEKARQLTGIREKTAVLHAGLEALIARESARRLAALGGSDRTATAPPRRRSLPDGPFRQSQHSVGDRTGEGAQRQRTVRKRGSRSAR